MISATGPKKRKSTYTVYLVALLLAQHIVVHLGQVSAGHLAAGVAAATLQHCLVRAFGTWACVPNKL